MIREFKFFLFSFLFLQRQIFQLSTKTIKGVQKAWAWEKKINHKGESASEQIVPKEIFLIECKVNSKNLDLEIERKTHKCQPVNKNILSYFGLFYQEARLIFITTYVTRKHTHPTPKLCKLICMYIMIISKVWELWSL